MSRDRTGRNWDVGLCVVLAATTAYMFWIGYGPTQGLVAGGTMLAVALAVGIVWSRSAGVRAIGGSGDERDRLISTRAQAATGRVLAVVLLGQIFRTIQDREADSVILSLALIAFVVYAGSLAYYARQA